jgi:hypothetical protein
MLHLLSFQRLNVSPHRDVHSASYGTRQMLLFQQSSRSVIRLYTMLKSFESSSMYWQE